LAVDFTRAKFIEFSHNHAEEHNSEESTDAKEEKVLAGHAHLFYWNYQHRQEYDQVKEGLNRKYLVHSVLSYVYFDAVEGHYKRTDDLVSAIKPVLHMKSVGVHVC